MEDADFGGPTSHTTIYAAAFADPFLFKKASSSAKQLSKRREKERVGKKFKVGDTIYLDNKKKMYILKKFIYTLHTDAVNVLIVKPISFEPTEAVDTLTRIDCRKYHIKYEPNLFVMPMNMAWHKLNTNNA